MANDHGTDLARQLALLMDMHLAGDWCSKPRIAVMGAGIDAEVETFEVDEPAISSLAELPRPRPGVVAVGLSALGHAISETEISSRVRVTVATSGRDVMAIVRSSETRRESLCVEGPVVHELRRWAGLAGSLNQFSGGLQGSATGHRLDPVSHDGWRPE